MKWVGQDLPGLRCEPLDLKHGKVLWSCADSLKMMDLGKGERPIIMTGPIGTTPPLERNQSRERDSQFRIKSLSFEAQRER